MWTIKYVNHSNLKHIQNDTNVAIHVKVVREMTVMIVPIVKIWSILVDQERKADM